MKEINARLEKVEPKVCSSDGVGTMTRFVPLETKSFNPSHKRGSPRAKSTPRETSVHGVGGPCHSSHELQVKILNPFYPPIVCRFKKSHAKEFFFSYYGI